MEPATPETLGRPTQVVDPRASALAKLRAYQAQKAGQQAPDLRASALAKLRAYQAQRAATSRLLQALDALPALPAPSSPAGPASLADPVAAESTGVPVPDVRSAEPALGDDTSPPTRNIGHAFREAGLGLQRILQNFRALSSAQELQRVRSGDGTYYMPPIGPGGRLAIIPETPEQQQQREARATQALFENVQAIAETERQAAEIPQSQAVQRVLSGNARGPLDYLSAIVDLGISSSGYMLAGLAGAGLGAATAGPAGAAAGAAAGTFATEFGASFLDGLERQGVNVASERSLMAALSDPEIVRNAMQHAGTRAAVVAGVDAASAGILGRIGASRFMTRLSTLGKAGVRGGQVGLEVASEGAGEALAQQATTGEVDRAEVLAEVLGGIGAQAPATVGAVNLGVRGFRERQARQAQEEADLLARAEELPEGSSEAPSGGAEGVYDPSGPTQAQSTRFQPDVGSEVSTGEVSAVSAVAPSPDVARSASSSEIGEPLKSSSAILPPSVQPEPSQNSETSPPSDDSRMRQISPSNLENRGSGSGIEASPSVVAESDTVPGPEKLPQPIDDADARVNAPVALAETLASTGEAVAGEPSVRYEPGSAAERLAALYDRAKADPRGADEWVDYRRVEGDEATRLREATGLDLDGYTHSVDAQSIRKIDKSHGSSEAEAARGQLPVTREDIARIPEITSTPDEVTYDGEYGADRLEKILYKKRVNGTVYLVEVARRKRRKLVPVTMWKRKAGDGPTVLRATGPEGDWDRSPVLTSPGPGVAQTSETRRGNPAKVDATQTGAESSAVSEGRLPADTEGTSASEPATTYAAPQIETLDTPGKLREARAALVRFVDRLAGGRLSADERSGVADSDDRASGPVRPGGEARTVGQRAPVRGTLLAKAIARDIKRHRTAAIIGQRVRGVEDLATLMQIYRDPRWETMRYVFVRGGEVVHHEAVSIRLPGAAAMWPAGVEGQQYEWMRGLIDAYGADAVYMVHNHPSGDPQPSEPDIRLTQAFMDAFPEVRGHVVIDSNKYAVISREEGVRVVEKDFGPDRLLEPEIPHPTLGQKVGSSGDLAALTVQLRNQGHRVGSGTVVVVGVSSDLRDRSRGSIIRSLLQVDEADLRGPRGMALLRDFARKTGAKGVFVVGADRLQRQLYQPLFDADLLIDAIYADGASLRELGHLSESGRKKDVVMGRNVAEGGHSVREAEPDYIPGDDRQSDTDGDVTSPEGQPEPTRYFAGDEPAGGPPADAGPAAGTEPSGGRRRIGRPDLANPAESEDVRRAIDEVDELRTQAGKPDRQTFEAWRKEAQQRLDRDYEGEKRRLFSGQMEGPVDVMMGKLIVEREGARAIREGSKDELAGFALLVDSYRSQRTEQARALAAGRDPLLTPEERAKQMIFDSVLMPSAITARKLRQAEERIRKRQGSVESAQTAAEQAASDVEAQERIVAEKERKAAEALRRRREKQIEATREKTAQIREEIARLDMELAQAKRELAGARKELQRLKAKLKRQEATARKVAEQTEAIKKRILQNHTDRVLAIRRALQKYGIDVTNLTDEQLRDRRLVAQIIRTAQAGHSSIGDAVYEYWINALLSAPTTQAANIIGNSANAFWDFTVQRWVEATINEVLPGSKRNAAQMGELTYAYRALGPAAIRKAWRRAVLAFDAEAPIFAEEMGYNGVTKFEPGTFDKAIPGTAGRFVRVPGRMLVAADEFFKSLFWDMQVAAEAYRIARSEGLRGRSLEQRMSELIADPQSDAGIAAWEKALDLTFQSEPGNITKLILRAREADGMVGTFIRYVVPFVTTPSNVLKTGLRKSPLGAISMLYKAARHGLYTVSIGDNADLIYQRREFVRDAAEQVLAWAIGYGLLQVVLGQDDDEMVITGTGASWNQTGKVDLERRAVPPTSIRIGDTYYDYSRVEPLGTALALLVNGAEQVKAAARGRAMEEAFGEFMGEAFGVARDKSFLMGFGDLMRVIEAPQQGAPRWISRFLSSWTPNVIKSFARADDPLWRKGSNDPMAGTLYRTLPLKAWAPPPSVDLWGRDMEKMGVEGGERAYTTWLYDVTVPVWRKEADAATKLDRLILNWNAQNPNYNEGRGFYPALPKRRFTQNGVTVEMTDQEYHDYLQRSGQMAFEILSGMDLNVDHPTETDIEIIDRVIRRTRQAVRAEMFSQRRDGEEESE